MGSCTRRLRQQDELLRTYESGDAAGLEAADDALSQVIVDGLAGYVRACID